MTRFLLLTLVALAVSAPTGPLAIAADPERDQDNVAINGSEKLTPAERGYRFLTEHSLVPSDFHQSDIDALWQVWPEKLRREAESATPQQRREMVYERYGLTPRPNDDSGKPLQYVVDEPGNWTINCFSCHGGSVYGTPTPGAPNNRYALQTLTEEITKAKLLRGRVPGRLELGSMVIPLGTTNGTTNAVVFGMGLMHNRDAQLNVVLRAPRFFTHHDMDAPPWWHFRKRPYLYIDGFAQKGHRGLMQFTLVPENGPQFYRDNESHFEDVYAYLESLRPPKYPGRIDRLLAKQGSVVFRDHCAECHGTYGEDWTYPNRRVPIEEIGTDPVRLTALPVDGRKIYGESWFAHAGEKGEQTTVLDPNGYVAPPLDGIWASAPYFHNGSVPTLWHVLHPSERPEIWRPASQQLDEERIGLTIETAASVPATDDAALRRSYFDTKKFGKSRSGHDYPEQLTAEERRAVLEYLKTL